MPPRFREPCPACGRPLVETATQISVCCNANCELAGDLYKPVRTEQQLGKWLLRSDLGVPMRPKRGDKT